ncbi:MAG: tetratricopeptide repeat protein [Bryobacteraceae bacterium]|nr:tetratricopeptide repeat protein [Bryobacteraceae bacterium]
MLPFFRIVFILSALSCIAFAAPSKELVQIQRDIAQLQDQIRQMQSAMEERIKSLTALVQQTIDTSGKTNTSLSSLQTGLSQQLATPITGVTAKVDQMSTEFQGVRENVTAMNETLTKVQAQLIDLSNAVKVLQTPVAPPPSAFPSPGGSTLPGGMPAGGPPAGLSAKQIYDQAMADRSRGNFDLATQGFQEYLKWFGDSELAPNAQFYIGQIAYDKNEFPGAIRAFDTVLEKYGENNKSADATYMKGMALLKSGQRTQAAQEFLTVIQKYGNSEVASKAKTQRKALGLSVPSANAAPRRR